MQWIGSDLGAGVSDYTIYVSEDGSPFEPLVANTTDTVKTFVGEAVRTYGFYGIAHDFVGHLEPSKTRAEATTAVIASEQPEPGDLNADGLVDCSDATLFFASYEDWRDKKDLTLGPT